MPMNLLKVTVSFFLLFLLAGCDDEQFVGCLSPEPSDVAFHGQYTWVDGSDPANVIRKFQFSLIKFFALNNGSKRFTLRVDTTVANPVRRFNDLTASYRFLSDSLVLTDPIIGLNGTSDDVPVGGFIMACVGDSQIFVGLIGQDTVMRFSIQVR